MGALPCGRYGGQLVAHSVEVGCLDASDPDCSTGGKVLTVFFSVIMGSMALGQVINWLFVLTR